MTPVSTKKTSLLLYYQCALAIVSVFVFFTDLDEYLPSSILPSINALLLIIAFGFASTPLLISQTSRLRYLPKPLLVWCAGYVLISVFYFWLFVSPDTEFQELRNRILSVIFILIMVLILSKYHVVQLCTRYAIIIACLWAVFNNFYEFFNPLVFNALNDTGRPAGFYVDPNKSGCGLMLGMIVSVGLLKPTYRVLLVSIVGIGVFLTFSRGATLSWLVVMMIFLTTGVLPRKKLLYWIFGLGMIIISLGKIAGSLFNLDNLQDSGLVNQNILGRLDEFSDPSAPQDAAAKARIEVVKIAWKMFAEHPFLGNGIGSTTKIDVGASHDISTHNMYLYFMADHGILGVFILPLLVYAVTRHSHGEMKYISFAYATFILIWGFFSHNILTQRFILLTFSLMATMNQTTQLAQKSHS